MAADGTHTLRCDDATWKRLRVVALAADKTLGEMLAALLDRYEEDRDG